MSQNKTHSHPIFVLTLAVYLGLVLAGGASPALAQAAMAKGFDLQVEQEFKDDLDKKPDEKEEDKHLSEEVEDYLRMNEWFLDELLDLHSDKNFNAFTDTFVISEESSYPCGEDKVTGYVHRGVSKSRDVSNQQLAEAVDLRIARSLEGFETLSACLPKKVFEWKNTADVGIKVSYDLSSLKIEAFLLRESPQKAKQFLEKLLIALKSNEPDGDDQVEKVLYDNTKIVSDNDQVTIVTNLPRAGLDALLAVK